MPVDEVQNIEDLLGFVAADYEYAGMKYILNPFCLICNPFEEQTLLLAVLPEGVNTSGYKTINIIPEIIMWLIEERCDIHTL